MTKRYIYLLSALAVTTLLLNGCSLFHGEQVRDPVTLPDAKDVEMFMIISKDGKVDFVGAGDNKDLREYHIGDERPINIEKVLPGKVIKTIDQVIIFSGSPTCVAHDGWVRCR